MLFWRLLTYFFEEPAVYAVSVQDLQTATKSKLDTKQDLGAVAVISLSVMMRVYCF